MITINNITLSRGINVLLEKTSATITPQQKVGLIGKNGSGKSTLFALIQGLVLAEQGDFSVPKAWAIAWVKQETPSVQENILDYVLQGDQEYTKLQQLLSLANKNNDGNKIAEIHAKLDIIDAWTLNSRASALLHGLGFSPEDLTKNVTDFSGGWRMRLNLAQALLCDSDLLLLDEPTNHLDLDAVIWLETWLKQYNGTLILISHDRDFIDAIVNKIIHIENRQLHEYTGNYANFEQYRALKIAQQSALYMHQQQKISHLENFIDRFKAKASKAKQAQSRIKQLEKMSLISKAHIDSPFNFQFKALDNIPNPLLAMQNVNCGYNGKTILSSIKLNLVPGSRIGILGKNGAGKSTLIKLLAQEISVLNGNISHAKGLKIGYFAQHQLDTLRQEHHAIWHLSKLAPQLTEQEARNYLAGFAFSGDKVYQNVASFSGGEKARLVLALIVWQAPNLLLLDEPTNHLDIEMRQALTEALISYQGSLIIISHDRHLLNSTVDEFYLVANKSVSQFDGNLEDYRIWLQNQEVESISINKEEPNQTNEFLDRKQQKKYEAELRQKTAPFRKKIELLESKIDKIEHELQLIKEALTDNAIYSPESKTKLTNYLQTQRDLKTKLANLEIDWLDLHQQIENIEQDAAIYYN